MPRLSLDDIFSEEDELKLLDVKPSDKNVSTEDDRIVQSLEEINRFIDRFGYLPGQGEKPSVSEQGLKFKLSGLRGNADLFDLLKPHDRHDLFEAKEEPLSLDDILDLDEDILSTPADDIFTFKHARPYAAKPDMPDHVSQRKTCEDFELFKPAFDECVRELKSGQRVSRPFAKEQEIAAGEFFILNGVMVYVAEVGEQQIRNGKKNARLRTIFDNGTEGNNLLRSLATELYKDPNGRRVTSPDAGPLFDDELEEGDAQTGMVYVLRSLSGDPAITKLDGLLHKIGFTSGKMEVRIQNAEHDPTFLMAPVHPVATYALYNIDKVKLENLLHRFFADVRLDIEIPDRMGKVIRPREWFLVSKEVIAEAIQRLKDGSIVDYRFDSETGKIIHNNKK